MQLKLRVPAKPRTGGARPALELRSAKGREALRVAVRAREIAANLGEDQGARRVDGNEIEFVVADACVHRDDAMARCPKVVPRDALTLTADARSNATPRRAAKGVASRGGRNVEAPRAHLPFSEPQSFLVLSHSTHESSSEYAVPDLMQYAPVRPSCCAPTAPMSWVQV